MKEVSGKGPSLVGPDISEEGEAIARKRFDGCDSTHLAPVGTVFGEGEAGVIVGGEGHGRELRAVGEGDVIGGEAFVGEGGRGDDEGRAHAEAKEEDRAMSGRETGQGLVEGFFEEVEVAKDGKGIRRAGREVLLLLFVV